MTNTVDLSVKIGSLRLRNPLILGAGPAGRVALGLIKYAELGFGAVVTKTITPEPWGGNPTPRDIMRGKDILFESSGIPNVGYKVMIEEIKEAKDKIKNRTPIIVNITSETPEEFAEMSYGFERAGADAIELAIFGCPNYKPGTKISKAYWEKTPERIELVIKTVKSAVSIPIWIKFWLVNFESVKAAEKAGADAVHMLGPANPTALPIDGETGKPLLGHPRGTGCIFGPFAKYPGLKVVADLCRTVKIPVLGDGGVWEGQDVIEYIMAGAVGAQCLTSIMMRGPKRVRHILKGIEEFMERKHISNLDEIRGITLKYLPPVPYNPME